MMRAVCRVLLCVAMMAGWNANAAMINKDWRSSGDALVSFDRSSGLDWLKLSATKGRTWRDISAHLSDEFQGWRFPTVAEVRDMAERNFGKSFLSPAFSAGKSVSLSNEQRQSWYDMMGRTDSITASFGYVATANNTGVFGVGLFPGGGFNNLLYSEPAKDGHAHSYFIGIYLVRDAVSDVDEPIPLAALLLLLLFVRIKNRSLTLR